MTPEIEKKLRHLINEWRKDKEPTNSLVKEYVIVGNMARHGCADDLELCLDQLIRNPDDT
jgi:hypothetical protein